MHIALTYILSYIRHIIWRIYLHIILHILPIGKTTYLVYSAIFFTYHAYNFTYIFAYLFGILCCILFCIFCILSILHILHIAHVYIFCILYIYILRKQPWLIVSPSLLPLLLVSAGPSCWRTTTYIHRHCYGIYHRQLLENRLILSAFQRVSSRRARSLPVEQVVGVLEVCRILEWHTILVIVHGARTRWWTDTHQPMLWQKGSKIRKICKICGICINDLIFLDHCTLPTQRHRHNRGPSPQCLFLNVFWTGGAACRTKCYLSWAQKRPRINTMTWRLDRRNVFSKNRNEEMRM
jgi:hypothetical protein